MPKIYQISCILLENQLDLIVHCVKACGHISCSFYRDMTIKKAFYTESYKEQRCVTCTDQPVN